MKKNRFTNPYISPLRYPGGKRKLIPLIADLISRSQPVPLLVEPFAGGASVSIGLLEAGCVENIALSDKDFLVASFWKTVFSARAAELAEMVRSAEITLDNWKVIKRAQPSSEIEAAFNCIFLNRTSFSGILNDQAGPIGGQKQQSEYTIDCRFNREKLASRILELSKLREKVVFVECQDYAQTFDQVRQTAFCQDRLDQVLWYFDPPFFEKADKLYRHTFSDTGHLLFRQLLRHIEGHWILSYDDVPQARHYYSSDPGFARVNLSYNARIDSNERLSSSEIVVSDIIAELRLRQGQGCIPAMGEVLSLKGFQETISDTSLSERSSERAV